MSITVSAGIDPATTSIRQNCLDGSYDYLETTYGPMQVAQLIAALSVELARMHQYARAQANSQNSSTMSAPMAAL